MEPSIIYLACPYAHSDPTVRQSRYEAATRAAAEMMRKGLIVFSPITMTHPIGALLAGAGKTPESDYWIAFDEAFLSVCSKMVVLQMEGWQTSNGIAREIAFFEKLGRPVTYVVA